MRKRFNKVHLQVPKYKSEDESRLIWKEIWTSSHTYYISTGCQSLTERLVVSEVNHDSQQARQPIPWQAKNVLMENKCIEEMFWKLNIKNFVFPKGG